jgi:uncharacterized membrane protein
MTTSETKKSNQLYHRIRRRLLAGIFFIVPLWLTFLALRFVFLWLDGIFAPLVSRFFGFSIPGLGFIVLLIFLYLVGLIATNILGRSIVQFWEAILGRIPFVRDVYQWAKQLIQTISASKTMGFKRVVFIEYPRKGLFAIAFVTNFVTDNKSGKKYTVVFIPSPPNPFNGFFGMMLEEEIMETSLTIEEGIKMVISGGLVTPEYFTLNRENRANP